MDNNSDHNWLNYLFIVVISLWGGFINYIARMRSDGALFIWRDFVMDLAVSMFAGFLVGLAALSFGVDPKMALALAGVGGHAGSRTIFLITRIFHTRLESFADKR